MPFGFSFGGSTKNESGSFQGTDTINKNTDYTQGSQQNFTQSSTPTNPDWVVNGAQGIYSGAAGLAGANPQSYVAGQNGLQTQANNTASGLTGNPDVYGAALGETGYVMNSAAAHTGAAQAAPYISQYMNPYINSVANATKADLDANDAQTRAAQDLKLAQSGAFGGSGAALTIGQTEGQLERARATAMSGIYSQGFDTALNAAQQDAQRKQSANELNANLFAGQQDRALSSASQLANLASGYDANQRANVATQAQQGQALQSTQQQQAEAPLDLQAWLASQYSGLPLNLFQGQQQTGTQTGVEVGSQQENGTETQSGSSKGKTSGLNFGFTGGGK